MATWPLGPKTKITMAQKNEPSLLQESARAHLDSVWAEVLDLAELDKHTDSEWSSLFSEIIEKGGSTYPYVLVTQVLGKCSDASLNALCLQDSSPLMGAWDARSLASKVVVPWNESVGRPLSGVNPDPYVNNPARHKNFGDDMRAKARNKEHFDILHKVANHLQVSPASEASRLFRLVLVEIRRHLESHDSEYFGPPRASLPDVLNVLRDFVAVSSNGVRLQVVVYALFKVFASAFPSFGGVRSYPTNSADAAGGRAGDIERVNDAGIVDFAIEVKDRTLSIAELDSTIMKARAAQVFNILFLVQAKSVVEDDEKVSIRIAHEFSRGIDINVSHVSVFFRNSLILLTPEQRSALLRVVHDSLHELGAHFKHRQHWQELMRSL